MRYISAQVSPLFCAANVLRWCLPRSFANDSATQRSFEAFTQCLEDEFTRTHTSSEGPKNSRIASSSTIASVLQPIVTSSVRVVELDPKLRAPREPPYDLWRTFFTRRPASVAREPSVKVLDLSLAVHRGRLPVGWPCKSSAVCGTETRSLEGDSESANNGGYSSSSSAGEEHEWKQPMVERVYAESGEETECKAVFVLCPPERRVPANLEWPCFNRFASEPSLPWPCDD